MSVTGPDGACDPLARIINVGSRELQAQTRQAQVTILGLWIRDRTGRLEGLGHRLGGVVTGCSASTNAQLRQGLGVKSLDAVRHTFHMSCGQIGDPQAAARSPLILAASQLRRLAYASLIRLDQSPPGGALAQSDCTKSFVGLDQTIHQRSPVTRRAGEW